MFDRGESTYSNATSPRGASHATRCGVLLTEPRSRVLIGNRLLPMVKEGSGRPPYLLFHALVAVCSAFPAHDFLDGISPDLNESHETVSG